MQKRSRITFDEIETRCTTATFLMGFTENGYTIELSNYGKNNLSVHFKQDKKTIALKGSMNVREAYHYISALLSVYRNALLTDKAKETQAINIKAYDKKNAERMDKWEQEGFFK